MRIKSLMTAAEAAGYAMAPDEDYFHDSDDVAPELSSELVEVAHGQERAGLPAVVSRTAVAETWFRSVLGGYLGRRATA